MACAAAAPHLRRKKDESMKLFTCRCGNPVHFENDRCVACDARLAYAPEMEAMVAFDDEPPSTHKLCKNGVDHQVCNWLFTASEDGPFCRACRLNQVIPALDDEQNRIAWLKIETAKRRLVYTLASWRLPLLSKKDDPENGLAFAFLKQEPGRPPVLTGHSDGLITLNIAEANDPFREKTRQSLGEGYRTLLGHFRHESGHYYWDRLVRDDKKVLSAFRDLFGDESAPYEGALRAHYDGGGEHAGWEESHVSAYAASHPWEDWAETWAHYFHLWDTMETSEAFGISLVPPVPGKETRPPALVKTGVGGSFDQLMAGWPALTLAINALNRSMGLRDAYPFAVSAKVIRKMNFVHDLVATFRPTK
jgi:hypothetical protein